ncbi:MAG: fimbrial protein [Plesiomonas sp.]
MKFNPIIVLLCAIALLYVQVGRAASNIMEYTIRGAAIVPPCVINNNSDINVAFGNVNAENISDAVYVVTTVVPVDCSYQIGGPRIIVSGTAHTGFVNTNVLSTTKDNEGLGIALYKGGSVDNNKELTLNSAVDLSNAEFTGSQFLFTSLLVKSAPSILNPGVFTAVATIKVFYD